MQLVGYHALDEGEQFQKISLYQRQKPANGPIHISNDIIHNDSFFDATDLPHAGQTTLPPAAASLSMVTDPFPSITPFPLSQKVLAHHNVIQWWSPSRWECSLLCHVTLGVRLGHVNFVVSSTYHI
jgi:hypothetical protein